MRNSIPLTIIKNLIKTCDCLVAIDCRSIVTWQPLGGDRVKFEAVAETDGYVSIGLSEDKFMVSSSLFTYLNTSF